MKSSTIRRYTSVHTWTGITTGILLFVAFYAGSLSMFRDAIHVWASPDARDAIELNRTGVAHTPQDIVDAVLRQAAPPHEFTLFIPDGEADLAWANWRQDDGTGGREIKALLTPGDAARDRNAWTDSHAATIIEELHYTMGLPVDIGIWLFGIVTLLYGITIVTGLVIHLPHLIRDLFALRVGKNLKRLWQDAHNVIGVVSLPFHLMFVVTSLLLTLSIVAIVGTNYITLGGALPVTDLAKLTQLSVPRAEDDTPAELLPVTALLARAEAEVPGLTPRLIQYDHPATESGTVIVRGATQRSVLNFASVEMDSAAGQLLGADKPGEHNPSLAVVAAVTSLHFGQFGDAADLLVRWAYLLLGLLGAVLFYSGNLLWIESRRKRRQHAQPRHHVWLAKLTTGACIGTMLGISTLLLTTQLLPDDFADRLRVESLTWYAGLVVALLYAAWRPVARGAIELLWACAAVTALLPVANAFSALPVWRAASSGIWSVAGVDLAAIGFALGFALLARARRAVHVTETRTPFGRSDAPRLRSDMLGLGLVCGIDDRAGARRRCK